MSRISASVRKEVSGGATDEELLEKIREMRSIFKEMKKWTCEALDECHAIHADMDRQLKDGVKEDEVRIPDKYIRESNLFGIVSIDTVHFHLECRLVGCSSQKWNMQMKFPFGKVGGWLSYDSSALVYEQPLEKCFRDMEKSLEGIRGLEFGDGGFDLKFQVDNGEDIKPDRIL